MFSPLDQILVDEHLPELNNLLMKLSEMTNLKEVATRKGILVVFMLSRLLILKHFYRNWRFNSVEV